MNFGNELAAALDAAELAGNLIRREYESFVAIPDAPASISTHVDHAAQDAIVLFLHKKFPGDGICAEENTAALAGRRYTGDRVWIIDPIDGTRGFARKTGQFSVMIGFLATGRPVVGVVMEPTQDRYTYAWVGGGCWWKSSDGTSVRCSVSRRTLAESVLVQSWSKPGVKTRPIQAIKPAKVIETYSGGVKMAMVARGEADVYANTYERFFDWDVCAGHILVTEAGGEVTDLGGQPIRYQAPDFAQTRGLLATNGRIHADAVGRLK